MPEQIAVVGNKFNTQPLFVSHVKMTKTKSFEKNKAVFKKTNENKQKTNKKQKKFLPLCPNQSLAR